MIFKSGALCFVPSSSSLSNVHCTLSDQSFNLYDLQCLCLLNGFANHSERCYENNWEQGNKEFYLSEERQAGIMEVAGLCVRGPEI